MPNPPERTHNDELDDEHSNAVSFDIELDDDSNSVDVIDTDIIDVDVTSIDIVDNDIVDSDTVDNQPLDGKTDDNLTTEKDSVADNVEAIKIEAEVATEAQVEKTDILSVEAVDDSISTASQTEGTIDLTAVDIFDNGIFDDNKETLTVIEPSAVVADATDKTNDKADKKSDTVVADTAEPISETTLLAKATPIEIVHEPIKAADRKDAPRAVHVTTGSSIVPKGRLNKAPKLTQNGSRAFVWYALALLVLIVDQWTKWLAETHLTFHEPVPVIEPFLNWTLAYNYGAAFSFLADAGGWQKWFFSGLALVMSLFLIGYLIKAPRQARTLSIGLGLVLGGAVGNLIDRLLHGHVIDFIHVHYADAWHYPIFNIADMGICIGVALIIIDMIFLEKKRHV